jgi:hypothetical protein
MIEYEPNNVLAETIARVVAVDDLADLLPEDIDVFLSSLEWEPFNDEQVQRICGRFMLSPPSPSIPARPLANPRPVDRTERGVDRRAQRTKASGYRLACEELENRLPPSVYSMAAGEPTLELSVTSPAEPPGQSVRLWQDSRVVQIQAAAESWDEAPGAWRASAGHTAAALSDVFAGGAYRLETDASGIPGDDSPPSAPWESVFSDMECPCEASCGLQLAG